MWEQFLNMIGMGAEPQATTQPKTPSAPSSALTDQPTIGAAAAQGTAEQERQAKAAGFPSYQAQVLWSQQRERKRDKQTVGEKGSGTDSSIKQSSGGQANHGRPTSVFQHIIDVFHDANAKGH